MFPPDLHRLDKFAGLYVTLFWVLPSFGILLTRPDGYGQKKMPDDFGRRASGDLQNNWRLGRLEVTWNLQDG